MKNDPACPFIIPIDSSPVCYPGLTKREYFAAQALNGLCSHPLLCSDVTYIAGKAIRCADALISRLNEDTKNE